MATHKEAEQTISEVEASVRSSLLNTLLCDYVKIPRPNCDCGKTVIFPEGDRLSTCSKCGAEWELTIEVKQISGSKN